MSLIGWVQSKNLPCSENLGMMDMAKHKNV